MMINKDAEFLDTLGATFIADGDISTGLRLRGAAARLEKLDSQLQHLLSCGPYAQGKHDAYESVYERSNLPPAERAVGGEMAQTLGVAVQRIPTGQTAAHRQPARTIADKYPELKHLKLELKL